MQAVSMKEGKKKYIPAMRNNASYGGDDDMYHSKDGTKTTTAAGTKLGQMTPSIDKRSGVRLTRPQLNTQSAHYKHDTASNRKSSRKSKFPLRNQDSALASFKDF